MLMPQSLTNKVIIMDNEEMTPASSLPPAEGDLRRLQMVELAMLKEVVRICEKHGLTYYLSAGTFLGAVRHHGFIPWDDDADVRMPRPDYEKLLDILPGELSDPYFVNHFKYNPNAHRYFMRVENPKVKIQRTQSKTGEICNAWLDIFPLDGMPKNKIHNKFRQLRLWNRRMWLQISVFDEIVELKKKRPWHENLIIKIVKHTPIQHFVKYDKMWKKLDKAMKAYPVDKAKYLVNFMGYYKFRDMIPKSVYGKGAMYKFEDTEFNGPEDYQTFLRTLYGDYMKLPPEGSRNKHQAKILSIDTDA